MNSILTLQTQAAEHENMLAQLLESHPTVTGPEQEILEIPTPTESPSHVLVDIEEGDVMPKARPVKPRPREDPLGAFEGDKEE